MLTHATATATGTSNLASELKPAGETAAQVKVRSETLPASQMDLLTVQQPCCVCKDEKAARDECMLFTNSNDPQRECDSLVQKYKACMKGYGFSI